MPLLLKCTKCSRYTLNETKCPKCGGTVRHTAPARYSPQDKYGEYRRKAKRKSQMLSE
ncbi:MAG: RNA-protein complex protein Nop10 [Candidatus Thorarchaeota archaeon]